MSAENIFYLSVVGIIALMFSTPAITALKNVVVKFQAWRATAATAKVQAVTVATKSKYVAESDGAAACLTLAMIAKDTNNAELSDIASVAWRLLMTVQKPEAVTTTVAG